MTLSDKVNYFLNGTYPTCIDDGSDKFQILTEAGFENWSENNCFLYTIKTFFPNCSVVDLHLQNGELLGELYHGTHLVVIPRKYWLDN